MPNQARRPRDEDRAVDAAGELLDAGERGGAADELRRGLQDAERLVRLHAAGELDDAVGLHQAVGVEHQHVGIGAAPALDPVGDIAGLAPLVAPAVAVEDARADVGVGARRVDQRLLVEPDVGAGGVAQEEEVEGLAGAAGVDVAHHGAGGAEDRGGVLVVGGHEERRAAAAAAPAGALRRMAEEEAHERRDRPEGRPRRC